MSVRQVGLCLVTVLAVGLGGCATSLDLPESWYAQYAKNYVGIFKCGKSGQISEDTVSIGNQLFLSHLSKFNFDKIRLEKEVNWQMDRPMKVTDCQEVGRTISAWLTETPAQCSTPQQSTYEMGRAFTNAMPKQTICNRAGSQIFCSTY